MSVAALAQTSQQPQFTDRVDVSRIVVDARPLDSKGNAILGLTVDDFAVKIHNQPVRVESATWVGAGSSDVQRPPAVDARVPVEPLEHGRLIVFLFQKDLEPLRIIGLMKILFRAKTFVETLGPDDRVAIVSFDSHLKIWVDFTNDKVELLRILDRGLLLERPKAIGESTAAVSLTRQLSQSEGRKTYPVEKALRLLGEALEPLPGSKSIVLFGHGFGHLTPTGVMMDNEYDDALVALNHARAAVFSIDVTQADGHSLEVGLQSVSEETGGFYERTFHHPDRTVRRLVGALAGYYVLFVESPGRSFEWEELSVKLTRRDGTVLARSAVQR
jgi:VWFA-related protein